MQGFYCIEYPKGIKIGWGKDIDKRLSSHKSSGASIKNFARLEFDDEEVDRTLRKIMVELKLGADVIDNDQTTEVYKITPDQARKILEYIETTREITKEFIIDLMDGKDEPLHTQISYSDIRDYYGSRYKRPAYQRDVDKEHVNSIKEYIEKNYYSRSFYLPPILLARESSDNEKYIIIDGQHRCAAIHEINKHNPCMNKKISATIFPVLPMSKQISLFKSINSSKPMPAVKIADNYMAHVKGKVVKSLSSKFGENTVDVNTKLFNTLFCDDTLNKLLDYEVIADISDTAICEVIVDVNDIFIENISTVVGRSTYLNIDKDKDKDKDKEKENKEAVELGKSLSDLVKFNKNGLKKVVGDIREKRKYKRLGKVHYRRPFALKLLEDADFLAVYEFMQEQ